MSRPATSRLKCNPPLGRMPVLQFVPPAELNIDPVYQRSIESAGSQVLIRKIAQHWDWDLCLPLVVSEREGGLLFVIDGQHRWEAAKLRGDIGQLPCTVRRYASSADEAASFVHLNQQRRALSKMDLFKAAVASEDAEACALLQALCDAGLSVAPHTNYTAWKPGMVSNIAGIEKAWRAHGEAATRDALRVLARAYKGQVLRYAGTIFPGIVALRAAQGEACELDILADLVGAREQAHWRSVALRRRAENPNLKYAAASALAVSDAWLEATGRPSGVRIAGLAEPAEAASEKAAAAKRAPAPFTPDAIGAGPEGDGMAWCDQCDMRVRADQAKGCKSRFCSLRKAA